MLSRKRKWLEPDSKMSSTDLEDMWAANSSHFARTFAVCPGKYGTVLFARSPRLAAHLTNLVTKLFLRPALVVLLCLTALQSVSACPTIDSLPDFNCDGKVAIVVIGDSLVAGIGDTQNGNKGGYVLRTQERFPQATVVGFGVPGLRTLTLLKMLRKAFAEANTSELAGSLIAADLVVLDLGRNDRWGFGLPATTLRNLNRARAVIESGVGKQSGAAPLVVTAVLMYPNRGSQGPWVKELNKLILRSHSTERPADLRFDLVSKRLLSADNIHPTSKGYAAISQVFVRYLRREYPRLVVSQHADHDKGGLYDKPLANDF